MMIRKVIGGAIAVSILSFFKMAKAQQRANSLELHYTTEWQTNYSGKHNWVNLLSLSGEFPVWEHGHFSFQTISICKTYENRIIDDLQTFSNIEEENMPLNVFIAGYTAYVKKWMLFAGIRNMNEDYFIGEYTSLFTNSSCGIYPTISSNFTVANYPLSAMCLHGEITLGTAFTLKKSIYNGVAHELFAKDGTPFAIRPREDGVINITELSYKPESSDYTHYTLGMMLHAGYRGADRRNEFGYGQKINYALWASIEQSIYRFGNKEAGILLQASWAPADRNDCRYYVGAGVLLNGFISKKKAERLGVFVNRAAFREVSETAVEVTWQYELCRNMTIQPTLHCIKTRDKINVIGMLRLVYCIGN